MASKKELFEIARAPKGINSIESSNRIYDEKKYYYEEIYPNGELPWIEKPFDFINENPLYGKFNLNGDHIIPKSIIVDGEAVYKTMTDIGDNKDNVLVFDFVAEAFYDLKANIKSLVKAGWLSSAGPIADFEAKKGFKNLEKINELQKKMHYFIFVSQFLSSGVPKRKERISNISDFTNFLFSYLKEIAPSAPFTKSGIINAQYMTPMATGLCVEIDTKGYDDDDKKHTFLTDPNFNVYRIIARRFGFMVDRNVPWRLVADVTSFKMREYMRIAYEKNIIRRRQNAIIKARNEELAAAVAPVLINDIFDIGIKLMSTGYWEDPIGSNIFVEKFKGVSIYTVNPNYEGVDLGKEDIQALFDQAEKELDDVLVDVANETEAAGLTETKEFYNAKNPKQNDDGVANCSGETYKMCHSRILKFDKFFEIYYDIPYTDEIEEIKKIVYDWYLSYYVQNPVTKKRVLCSQKLGAQTKYTTKEIKLKLLSEEEYKKSHDPLYWVKAYFDIKLAENKVKLKSTEYNRHLKKIIELSTLNSSNSGMTMKNAGHTHSYYVDENGNGGTQVAIDTFLWESTGWHTHAIINWAVQPAQSNCYPNCVALHGYEGSPLHTHPINQDIVRTLHYINKIVKRKMKSLGQIYGKEEKKEQAIGELLLNASQNGMIP